MNNLKLNNENKINSGFKIPDNYFEQFEKKMTNHVQLNHQIKVIPLWKQKRIWFSSIAALLLISVGLPYYFSTNTKNEIIDQEVLESYIVMQPSINSFEIASHLTDEDIKVLEAELALNNQEIEEYLLNESEIDLY